MTRIVKVRIRKGGRHRSTMTWATLDLDSTATEEEVDALIEDEKGITIVLGLICKAFLMLAGFFFLFTGDALIGSFLLALVVVVYYLMKYSVKDSVYFDRESFRKKVIQRKQNGINNLINGK